MKNIYKLALLFILLLLIFVVVASLFFNKSKTAKVCFNQNCFLVEIAKKPVEKKRGLMFRKSLEQGKGMLFVFDEEGNYPFWMKNTLIPLDIIWLDKNQAIVFIKENAPPCTEICDSINPKRDAMYVLEVNSGASRQLKLKIGDKMLTNY